MINRQNTISIQLDQNGNLILPSDLMERYGLVEGAEVRIEDRENGLFISHSTMNLAKIYIEPTTQCNLDCRTCMRNAWQEPAGMMDQKTFQRILAGAQTLHPLPTLFFDGYGEPLAHPSILDMLADAKRSGSPVELITNGILLTPELSCKLIELEVDRIWVSLDGASPESYADIRLGSNFGQVVRHLKELHILRHQQALRLPRLGIAFVAMKRNIQDLPKIIQLGKSLGADQFSISNVLPHTSELQQQILYQHALYENCANPGPWVPEISLPRMDINETTSGPLAAALEDPFFLSLARQANRLGRNTCPFIEKASTSIRWDGEVSPCLALLHSSTNYLDEKLRHTHAYTIANINDQDLKVIWQNPEYIALRERLLRFDFSPCTFCNSCELSENNQEDCYGNSFPTCGGCLWGQGFIQCP